MSEYLLDDSEDRVEFIRPDPEGFTVRTNFRGTPQVLDRNAELRGAASRTFKDEKGGHWAHVASIPIEVYEMEWRRLGRAPTAKECVKLANQRDFNKLKTRDVRL